MQQGFKGRHCLNLLGLPMESRFLVDRENPEYKGFKMASQAKIADNVK